ncbi:MAG: FAD-binding oxidoreductase [Alphaproteobacteria bacterium]
MSSNLLYTNDRPGQHAPSYYAATAVGDSDRPSLEGDHEADVCIVGGGFTGLSSALHLAERGYSVILLDAHRAGWGASGRNGGQAAACPRIDQDSLESLVGKELAHAAWDIAQDANTLLRDLVARFDIPCDLKSGCIHADHRERFVPDTRAYVEKLQRDYDFQDIRFVDREEIRTLVGSNNYYGGTYDTKAAHLHPLNFALGLARAAEAVGAQIFHNSRVTDIAKGDPVRVTTETGSVRAKFLILACNGYLGDLDARVARRVMPINNFVIATEPLGEERAKSLIANDASVADSRFVVNYYRLSADKRMLFGGGESYGYRFPADIKGFVRKCMLEVYPQLADAKIDYGWGGTLGITMKRVPHFERLAGNIVSASGYSGSGVAMATGAGSILADAIDGVATKFDVMNKLPTPRFPGGPAFRTPLLILAMTWYALRDRL